MRKGVWFLILALAFGKEVEVGEVSVTAAREERKTEDVPANVQVVGEKKIKETKMFNLMDALSGIPGVFIQSRNQGYDTRLIIRGSGLQAPYGVRQIMILLNGVPITDPDSLTRLDFVDMSLVKQVEVSKGPNPLWGVNAAGGVINVITLSPFERKGGQFRIGVGDYNTRTYHFDYSFNFSNFFLGLSASRRQSDNSWRPWNKFWTNQITLQPAYMFQDGSTLEAYLSYTKASLQLPGALIVNNKVDQWKIFKETGVVQLTADPWKHMGRYSEIFFFSSKLTKEIGNLQMQPIFWINHWTHYHPVTGRISSADAWIYGFDLQNHLKNPLGSLTFGFTLRHDRQNGEYYRYQDVVVAGGRIVSTLSDRAGGKLEDQDQKTTLYGLYLQQSFSIAQKFIVDAGIRFDRVKFDISGYKRGDYSFNTGNYVMCPSPLLTNCFSYSRERTYSSVNPKLGLVYKLLEGVNAYASYSEGSQTPTASELSVNPDLELSRVRNYEVGLKVRRDIFFMDVAFYYSPVKKEVISYYEGGQTRFVNAGRTERKGLELLAGVRPYEGLELGVSYSFQHYKFKEFSEPVRIGSSIVNVSRNGNYLPYIPKQYYSLHATYKHPTGLKVRVQADTWGSYYIDNANSEKYGGYSFVTSLTLGYEKKEWDVALLVDNLFDQRYAVEVTKDVATATKRYTPAPPRTLMLRVSYNF